MQLSVKYADVPSSKPASILPVPSSVTTTSDQRAYHATIECRNCKDNHHIRDCTAECRGYCPRNAPSHYPRDCPAYLAKRTNAKAKGKSNAQVSPPSVVIDSGASDIYLNSAFRDSMTNHRCYNLKLFTQTLVAPFAYDCYC